MTLSNQLDAACSSRKPSKKTNRQQKASTTKNTPPPKDDTKKNADSKPKKPSGTSDKKNTLSPSQDGPLRRSFSIRKQLSNLVNSGASSLKRSFSFGKGLNEHASKKPWNSSLQSLGEDVFSTDEGAPVFIPDATDSGSSVFDSRKLVTRTQSLVVPKTRTKNDASAKKVQRLFSHREKAISHTGSRYGSSSLYHDKDRSLSVDLPDFSSQSVQSLPSLLNQTHETSSRHQRLYSRDEKRLAAKSGSTSTALRRQRAFKNDLPAATGRSRSLTHLDCLDPGELTSDVVMTDRKSVV